MRSKERIGSKMEQKLMLHSLINIFKPLYNRLFPSLLDYLKKELTGCDSVLDIGCGWSSPIQYCKSLFSIGVDKFKPYLKKSKNKHIHNQYIESDFTKLDFEPKSFDAILCLAVLEHLTKEEGIKLMKKMENWARKKIIVKTPNEYIVGKPTDGNPLMEHKCGWSVEELRKLGFKVHGMYGWRPIRRTKNRMRRRPFFLRFILTELTQKIVYYHPEQAAQLFAVKQTGVNVNETKNKEK